ncbi:hypothetical protein HPP92_022438 [Vanilla planifolia]|uniref:Uncharacterized protein n=1 Tax=Vanilla planifolia TaxID=51239 RepID=A0A835UFN3_VANPL|nr:hypothetical protein HPP92_022438 [Vanilla planifolia]
MEGNGSDDMGRSASDIASVAKEPLHANEGERKQNSQAVGIGKGQSSFAKCSNGNAFQEEEDAIEKGLDSATATKMDMVEGSPMAAMQGN